MDISASKKKYLVQEFLNKIGVSFECDTNIQIIKNLDYVIKIGDNLEETPVNAVKAIVNPMEDREQEQAPIIKIESSDEEPEQIFDVSDDETLQKEPASTLISNHEHVRCNIHSTGSSTVPRNIHDDSAVQIAAHDKVSNNNLNNTITSAMSSDLVSVITCCCDKNFGF